MEYKITQHRFPRIHTFAYFCFECTSLTSNLVAFTLRSVIALSRQPDLYILLFHVGSSLLLKSFPFSITIAFGIYVSFFALLSLKRQMNSFKRTSLILALCFRGVSSTSHCLMFLTPV